MSIALYPATGACATCTHGRAVPFYAKREFKVAQTFLFAVQIWKLLSSEEPRGVLLHNKIGQRKKMNEKF